MLASGNHSAQFGSTVVGRQKGVGDETSQAHRSRSRPRCLTGEFLARQPPSGTALESLLKMKKPSSFCHRGLVPPNVHPSGAHGTTITGLAPRLDDKAVSPEMCGDGSGLVGFRGSPYSEINDSELGWESTRRSH
jgi:hypothetical protein